MISSLQGVIVVRGYVLLFSLLISQMGLASNGLISHSQRSLAPTNLEICLTSAYKNEHRLNKIDASFECFQNHRRSLTIDSCYKSLEHLKIEPKSIALNEKLRSFCFYEIRSFSSVKSCLAKAKLFEIADSRDEAVFECYRQFQNVLNKKQCLQVSSELTYPMKKEHLINHCLNNVD